MMAGVFHTAFHATLIPRRCPRTLCSRRRLYTAQYGSSDEPILALTES